MQSNKKVLVINDFVNTSHVALNLQQAFLNDQQLDCISLPSALFSNTFNLGKPAMVDLSGYLKASLEQYNHLNFAFDGLLTGYLLNTEQVVLIEQWLRNQSETLIVSDPVMGDNGTLYQSLDRDIIKVYQRMVASSDVMVPNLTEAQLLLDLEPDLVMTHKKALELVTRLQKMNHKSVVITSVPINGQALIYGYDHMKDQHFKVAYEAIAGKFYGTGDLFSVALFYQLLEVVGLEEAVHFASENVSVRIMKQKAWKSL